MPNPLDETHGEALHRLSELLNEADERAQKYRELLKVSVELLANVLLMKIEEFDGGDIEQFLKEANQYINKDK